MVIDFSWSKECVISEIPIIPRIPGNPDANQPVQEMPTIQTTAGTFQIKTFQLLLCLLIIISKF